jgi:signal transduction histidine kinase
MRHSTTRGSLRQRIVAVVIVGVLLALVDNDGIAQQSKGAMTLVDSLRVTVERMQASGVRDTLYVRLLNELSSEYLDINPVLALLPAQQALETARRIADRLGEADALSNIGLYYRVQQQYDSAFFFLFQALQQAQRLGNLEVELQALNYISLVYFDRKEFNQMRQYVHQLASRAQQHSDSLRSLHWLAVAENSLGASFRKEGQYTLALNHLMTALRLRQRLDKKSAALPTLINIGSLYEKLGRFEEALEYQTRALRLADSLGNVNSVMYCCRNISNVYAAQGQYARALPMAERALRLSDSTNTRLEKVQFLLLLAALHDSLGNTSAALRYLKRAVSLKDSINNAEVAEKMAAVEAQFQNEKKQQQIAALQKERELELRNRWLLVLGVVLLVMLLVVVINSNRLKARSLKMLRETNAEIIRQQKLLEEQARDIEEVNAELETKNFQLTDINAQLDAKNERLRVLNQEKNEFLGIAAHDLKNPLASIVLSASSVRVHAQKMSVADIQKQMMRIEAVALRMKEIVSQILDANAIDSGMMNVHWTNVSLLTLAAQVVEDFTARAAEKHIRLMMECFVENRWLPVASVLHNAFASKADNGDMPSELSEQLLAEYVVSADERLAYEVIENIVSNAVKYSPYHSTVVVRVQACFTSSAEHNLSVESKQQYSERHGQHEKRAQKVVRVEVHDEGPGLTEDDKKKLFGKFMRLSARPTGGENSTGLGLSIVKKLVEAMNGRIWCESAADAGIPGATFIIEFPSALG